MAACLVIYADIIADLIEHTKRHFASYLYKLCSITGQKTADIVADLFRSVVK